MKFVKILAQLSISFSSYYTTVVVLVVVVELIVSVEVIFQL